MSGREPTSHCSGGLRVPERRVCRIPSAHSVHATTRMSARTREEHPVHRSARTSVSGKGTQEQLLVDLCCTAVHGTSDQVGVCGFQFAGALHRASENRFVEPRCIRLELRVHPPGELVGGSVVDDARGRCV